MINIKSLNFKCKIGLVRADLTALAISIFNISIALINNLILNNLKNTKEYSYNFIPIYTEEYFFYFNMNICLSIKIIQLLKISILNKKYVNNTSKLIMKGSN